MTKREHFSGERVAQECICCASKKLNRSSAIVMPFIAKRIWGYDPVEITADWGFRDIKPGFAYSLCNSLHCLNCGVVFLDIRFTDRELSLLYEGYRDDTYTSLRELFEPGYAEKNKFFSGRAPYIEGIEAFLLERIPAPNKILDWGGDTGVNTPLLTKAKEVHVFDISGMATIDGVKAVSLDEIKQNQYDLIICSQVLEHIPYPHNILQDIVSAMSDSTILYLEVPYEEVMREFAGSPDLAQRKRHWHEHINFFSLDSMRKLVEGAGLELIEIVPNEISLGWRTAVVTSVLCRKVRV
ncbi:class I SAM-dependent methyltransferase [Polynucleobacter sp.]|uniref:class I SAM-dependent methyltransferase n=1 Tax=Polynucleobacter sp. TaxID=2029855 RepID=UPI0027359156|nr:class I SAM-dependent methyltransferase [Polynucleobacter sp.]MDP3122717.1 class I SAM-dependent methyltransferase [Polynucleobacter sp.]